MQQESFFKNSIYFGDNLPILEQLQDASVDLIYIDPPFNTGKRRRRNQIEPMRSPTGNETERRTYGEIKVRGRSFADMFDDYLAFLEPRLVEAHRVLAQHGTLYLHIDYREVHYCKLLLDAIFGRECFLNEVIWAYDYGGRTKRRWPPKHDNILVYVKDPNLYTFSAEEVERIPYMAPSRQGPARVASGKLPTDTWWHTIVHTNGKEKTDYPTQKPLGVLKRIVAASSRPGDLVLDFFAGSGTTGAACLALGRRFLLIDDNPPALEVMARRFEGRLDIQWIGFDQAPFQHKGGKNALL